MTLRTHPICNHVECALYCQRMQCYSTKRLREGYDKCPHYNLERTFRVEHMPNQKTLDDARRLGL